MLNSILSPSLLNSALLFLTPLLKALALLIVGYLVARFAKARIFAIAKVKDEIVAGFISQLVFISILIIVLVMALSILGIPTTSILAVLGTAGIAIGFALKDSLSSIAGGVILIVLKPFKKGDIIEVSGLEGKIEAINLFNTTIRLHDNRLAIIPNKKVSDSNIINATESQIRRIEIKLGVSYDADLALVHSTISEVLAANPKLDSTKKPLIGVNELGDSSVIFIIRTWGRLEDGLFDIKSDLIKELKATLDSKKIEIPYQKIDIQIKDQR